MTAKHAAADGATALTDFWGRMDFSSSPFVHPDDRAALSGARRTLVHEPVGSFSDYVRMYGEGALKPDALHLSLYPQPYVGDLANADVVLLLLNPGLSHADYFVEYETEDFRRRLRDVIAQDDRSFLWLDPELCWTAGFRWWESRLQALLEALADSRFAGNRRRAREEMMHRVVSVELVPYHSKSFRAGSLIKRLSSAAAACAFVQGAVLPAAARDERTVVVTRKAREWGVAADAPGVTAYTDGRTRSASIGPNTEGGRAILRRLGVRL